MSSNIVVPANGSEKETREVLARLESPNRQRIEFPPLDDNGLHRLVNEQTTKDVLYLLLAFRFINALCVQTFFQPDEYFQSLEPAWQMAFGPHSGAWITWVRISLPESADHGLRYKGMATSAALLATSSTLCHYLRLGGQDYGVPAVFPSVPGNNTVRSTKCYASTFCCCR